MAKTTRTKKDGASAIGGVEELPAVAAYLKRINAEGRSMLSAVVKEQHGKYWRDIAVIYFTRSGDVRCAAAEYLPDEAEAEAIKVAVAGAKWPEAVTMKRRPKPPSLWDGVDKDSIYDFVTVEGDYIMSQVRSEGKDGQKKYVPWTFWSDNRWRAMEPEGKLPLWGLDQLKNHTTVFIHEGAKAASYIRWMVEAQTPEAKKALADHPWGNELSNAAHLGWIGGALSPARTDWTALMKAGVTKVYIVADNDAMGMSAVPAIARELRIETFHVQFTDAFPVSFDLADPFPPRMFKTIGKMKYYNGPSFNSLVSPATWATDLYQPPDKKGRPIAMLRSVFRDMWYYIETADLFVCVSQPELLRKPDILNKMLMPFSHAKNTTDLILREYSGRFVKLAYRPDMAEVRMTDGKDAAINLHVPGTIKPAVGDPTPWLNYMAYMFPNEGERKHMMRWCATLMARPDIRMKWGILLVSEKQGVGKTTLGQDIIAPIIGVHNCSFPREKDIVDSQFNGWLAKKRLIVVGEVYAGQSWKAYNQLKQIITDKSVEVNEKNEKGYTVENWAHVMASSNSLKALKMEESDRRWFYPTVTEARWTPKQFDEFFEWLGSGGLSIIYDWAIKYGDYVKSGEDAPMSVRKRDLIDESRSKAQQEAWTLGEMIKEDPKPVSMAFSEVRSYIERNVQGIVHDTDHELRKSMKDAGVSVLPERVKIGKRREFVVHNDAFTAAVEKAVGRLNGKSTPEAAVQISFDLSRKFLTKPNDYAEDRM